MVAILVLKTLMATTECGLCTHKCRVGGGLIGENSGTLTGVWNIRDLPSLNEFWVSYTYFKWDITGNKGNADTQAADFEMLIGGNPVAWDAGATCTDDAPNPGGEGTG